MRYRANSICTLNRLRHAETMVTAGKSPMPATRREPVPKSTADPASKNPRVEVERIGGGRRTLWTKPTYIHGKLIASSCGDICCMIATPQQLRMARAALRLSQADVAVRAGLSLTGYNDVEAERSSPRAATLGRIQEVLEREFRI